MAYIIKNCPAHGKEDRICYPSVKKYISGEDFVPYYCFGLRKPCKDISDCLLKQIVEKAKQMQNEWSEELLKYPDKYKFFKSGRSDAGKEILQMFEIEENNANEKQTI